LKQQLVLLLICTFSRVISSAQISHQMGTTRPGNPALVSSERELQELIDASAGNYRYSVEDYFAHPRSADFQLSPNGRYISFRERDEHGKSNVMVREVSTGKTVCALKETDNVIIGYGWVSDSRLLYMMDNGGNENYHLYAVNTDGSDNMDLTPYDGVRATILKRLPEHREYIIVSMNKDNPQNFEPYKVNVNTGELVRLYENNDLTNPVNGYDFDKDGNLRAFSKMHNGKEMQYFYKSKDAKEYTLVKTTPWYNKFVILSFNYASANMDEAYVLTDLEADKARIVLYDLKAGKIIREIYANKEYDVSGLSLSQKRNWEIDYIDYEGAQHVIKPVSKHFNNIYKKLKKQFKGYQFQIAAQTENEDQYLVKVSSDRLYGRFYHYDTKTGKAALLCDLMPQLKEEDMAVMRPITFKSLDGLTIHGYITLPPSASKRKKAPLIVNPHGGPHGIRDTWGFNPEAQLFASRGYATLHVNFRMSDGYGLDFFRAGFKQTGRKIMDDLEDGVHYVIDQGWVDRDNIGIYGGSHGGYATLMGLIKTPYLYKAGVDYVGISNISTFFDAFPVYWQPLKEMLKDIWYDLDDPEEARIAREVSPIYHTDKINAPLFVVQGANDPRVNILESDRIVAALRKRGVEVPYMVKYDEGHGFQKEANQLAFYKAMLGFFSLHFNKPAPIILEDWDVY